MKTPLFILFLLVNGLFLQAQNTALFKTRKVEFPIDLNGICNDEIRKAGNVNWLFSNLHNRFSLSHLPLVRSNAEHIDLILQEYNGFYSARMNEPIEFELRQHYPIPTAKQISIKNLTNIVDTHFVNILRKHLFKDPKQIKALYKACFPLFRSAFESMTPNEQNAYLSFIQDGIDYLAAFNQKKEALHWQNKKLTSEKEYWQAFLYRRVASGEISKKDGLFWLKKLKQDLLPACSKSNKKEDQYYLMRSLSGPFFLAKVFNDSTETIFEKSGETYRAVEIENIACLAKRKLDWGSIDFLVQKNVTGFFATFVMTDGTHKLYLLAPNKKPLDFGIIEDINSLNLERVVNIQDSIWIFSDGTIYALNKLGLIERQQYPKTLYVHQFGFFSFKDGSKKLFRGSAYNKLNLPTDIEQIYIPKDDAREQVRDYFSDIEDITLDQLPEWFLVDPIWLKTKDNALYIIKKAPYRIERLALNGELENFEVLSVSAAVATYKNGHKELFWVNIHGEQDQQFPIKLEHSYIDFYKRPREQEEIKYFIFINKEKKRGLMSLDGKGLIAPNYANIVELIHPADSLSYFLLSSFGGKKGLADRNGKIVIDTIYTYLSPCKWPLKNGKAGFLFSQNCSKGPVYMPNYKGTFKNLGLIDVEGQIIEPEEWFNVVTNLDTRSRKTAPIYFVGKEIAPGIVKHALFSKNFNQLSNFVFDADYSIDTVITFDPETFNEIVNVIIAQGVAYPISSSKQFFAIDSAGKKVVYDFTGKQRFKEHWEDIKFYDHLPYLVVQKNGYYGLIDSLENTILDFNYKSIYTYTDVPFYFVEKNVADSSLAALYSPKAQPLTDFLFSKIQNVIPDYYTDRILYTENIAVGEWHSVELKNIILKAQDKYLLYGFDGKVIFPEKYAKIEYIYDKRSRVSSYFKVKQKADGLYALADATGTLLSDFVYKDIDFIDPGFFSCKKPNNSSITLDKKGNPKN